MRGARARSFIGAGGTRRGSGARTRDRDRQQAMFDDPTRAQDPDDDPDFREGAFELGELARDIHRMTLETSSNVYAQRRSTW